MTGSPCTSTSGNLIDSFATAGTNTANAIIGSQFFTGTAQVAFSSVATRFGSAKTLKASIYNIPYNNGGTVTGWTLSSTQTVTVSNNAATVSFNAANGNDAWGVVLSV